MVDKKTTKGEGWSKAEEDWINNLPFDDFLDLMCFTEYGVESEEEKETLERLRESYAKLSKKR